MKTIHLDKPVEGKTRHYLVRTHRDGRTIRIEYNSGLTGNQLKKTLGWCGFCSFTSEHGEIVDGKDHMRFASTGPITRYYDFEDHLCPTYKPIVQRNRELEAQIRALQDQIVR